MKGAKDAVVLIFFIVVCVLGAVSGDLKISGTKCGTKICKTLEYCSVFDNQCYPCSNICNEKTHNYDPVICTKDCQEYIHDIRYVRRDDAPGNENLRDTVQRLQYTLTVTLTLLCLVILILVICSTIQIYKWKKKNNVTFASLKEKFCSKKSGNNSKSNANNGISARQLGGKPDLRIDMPSPGTQNGEHSPVTMTTSISRRPAEDSALDYAYDNRAMSNTPSPH